MATKPRPRATYVRDMLQLDSGQLDEFDKFKVYGESTDAKGHSDSVRMRMPKGTLASINSIIELAPQYRSNHDFIRSWTVIGMQVVGAKLEAGGEFDSRTLYHVLQSIEDRQRDFEDETEELQIEELEERLEAACRRGKPARVEDVLDRATVLLEKGPTAVQFVDRLERVEAEATSWLKFARAPEAKNRRRNAIPEDIDRTGYDGNPYED
jgi:hypothetical protein